MQKTTQKYVFENAVAMDTFMCLSFSYNFNDPGVAKDNNNEETSPPQICYSNHYSALRKIDWCVQ